MSEKKRNFSVDPVFFSCWNIMSSCVALTKPSCAKCGAHITVFYKLSVSESVAVRGYLMMVV